MHLLKVRPDKVAEHWEFFAQAILASLPPGVTKVKGLRVSLLMQILAGKMQVWLAVRNLKYPPQSFCAVTTTIVTDAITQVRTLVLFSAYSWDAVTQQDWEEGFRELKKYAVSENCTGISFYTQQPALCNIAKKFGFLTTHLFGVLEISPSEEEK